MKIITFDPLRFIKQKTKQENKKNLKENLKALFVLLIIFGLYALAGTIEYNSLYK